MLPYSPMETVPLTPREPFSDESDEEGDDDGAEVASVRSQRSTYLSFFRSPPVLETVRPPAQGPRYEPALASNTNTRLHSDDPPAISRSDDDDANRLGDVERAATAPGYLPATSRPTRWSLASAASDDSSVFSSVSAAYSQQLEDHLSQISSQSHLFGEPLLNNLSQQNTYDDDEDLDYLEQGRGAETRYSEPSCDTASASVAVRHLDVPGTTALATEMETKGIHRDAYQHSNPRGNLHSGCPASSPPFWNQLLAQSNRIVPLLVSAAGKSTRRIHQQHNGRPSMSPTSKRLQDYDYLMQQHAHKMQELQHLSNTNMPSEHYDFCLVLQPQNVYGYWADLLDFRQELLGLDADALQGMKDHKRRQDSTTFTPDKVLLEDDDSHFDLESLSPTDLTPTSAMLRRRRALSSSSHTSNPLTAITNVNHDRQSSFATPSIQCITSSRFQATTSARKSVFERAIGSPSTSELSRSSISLQPSAVRPKTAETGTPFRRRWGAGLLTSTPSAVSPPIRSLSRGTSSGRFTCAGKPSLVINPDAPPNSPRENPNELRLEDIPPQRFARGIAARTNGMLPFLRALKRGIVVRKHRPGQDAVFCRLSSDDGGDTVRFTVVSDQHEAMNAFKEQRVRYNTQRLEGQDGWDNIDAQPWSYANDDSGDDDDDFSVPNFVAAQRYREKLARERRVTGARVTQFAVNAARVGYIRAADIAVVHPAVFTDPRSEQVALGTSTLRRSKSEYCSENAFSLVMRNDRLLARGQPLSIDESEEKWLAGKGNEAHFRYHDFETATIGEYWLVFRGFLLLHRDAAVGRFAATRAAGIGSHYNRLEMEQRVQAHDDDHNILNPDAFYEPKTVGFLERMIVKYRNLDATYLQGFTQPGAVPPPSDYFLGFRSPGTAIWSRLRFAGMETCRVYSLDPNRVMIKVRCPPERMLDVAEVLRLKLKTKDGVFAEFRESKMDLYERTDDLETPAGADRTQYPFRSSIRTAVMDFIIGSRIRDSGAELAQNTELGKMILARVPLHMHAKLDAIFSSWLYFWRTENWEGKNGSHCRPMEERTVAHGIDKAQTNHTASSSSMCDADDSYAAYPVEAPKLWKRFLFGCFNQPLDAIEEYFGTKVAFYFAWLQHTACHLVFLSVAGLILFIAQISSGKWDHPLRPLFSVVVMIWTFLVLVNWKKRANLLAYQWGTLDYEHEEVTRPQFRGDYTRDNVTGEWVVTYPKWKRWLKSLVSMPLTIFFTVGALILILWVHANRDLQLDKYYDYTHNNTDSNFKFEFAISAIGRRAPVVATKLTRQQLRDPTFWFIIVGMPSVLGLFLPLVNLILMKISVMLNDFENYRTDSEYRTWLIVKVFSFRFVCYFATLYYYAFISVGSEQAIENGILRVASGVLVYTTVAQWWQNFLHVCFPMFVKQLRLRHRRQRFVDELRAIEIEEEDILGHTHSAGNSEEVEHREARLVNKRLLLEQAQDEVWLEVLNPMHDSFPEYIQAIVQFTFCSCFSVVLPITPLICLFNYLLFMRLDAYKLCKGRRRPLAEKTGGIGIWEHLMHIVAVISVFTNCWLMGFTSATFSHIGDVIGQAGLLALVVGWEHVMLLIHYIMRASMSPLPQTVQDARRRDRYELDKQQSSSILAKRLQHQREHDAVTQSYEQENSQPRDLNSTTSLPASYSLQTIPSEDADDDNCPQPHGKHRTSESSTSTEISGNLSVE